MLVDVVLQCRREHRGDEDLARCPEAEAVRYFVSSLLLPQTSRDTGLPIRLDLSLLLLPSIPLLRPLILVTCLLLARLSCPKAEIPRDVRVLHLLVLLALQPVDHGVRSSALSRLHMLVEED